MKAFDVAVIGAGVMGAATARALAKRGKKVVLLEQVEVGHTRGSSHGTSRIFRFSYPSAEYVKMAQESLPLWRELERESGETLLTITGGLDRGPHIAENAAALSSCGASYEIHKGAAINQRFAGLSLPPDEPVLLQGDAGYLAADACVSAFVSSAVTAGAEVRERSRVDSIKAAGDGVEVETAEGMVHAQVAVVTAGAWAAGILGSLGIDLPLRPTRETVAYFATRGEVLPPLVEWGHPAIYALPAPGVGIKAGEHQAGPTVDPDEVGGPDEASLARVKQWVRDRFPLADPEPLQVETCLYTNTPDEGFVLERFGNVVVGSPCSGHGFKFAPLIGERLADLAVSK
ncbi:MAG: N-methyl-L-tryptophan oxidase [Dehalococcoidia bacterium]